MVELNHNENIILLDVDGCLNPDKPDLSTDWSFETAVFETRLGQFTLVLSKQMAEALAGLNANIVWLTSWYESANSMIGNFLGWPEKPVLHRRRMSDEYWKLSNVCNILSQPGKAVIWIDDEIGWQTHYTSKQEIDRHNRLTMIQVDPKVGITKAQIEEITNALKQFD